MELGGVSTHGYYEFEGSGVDLGRLEEALRRLIARHDMLRAVVLPDGRQQVLAQVPAYELNELDLRGMEAEASAEALAEVRRLMSHQVLPADRWPLFELRATLLDGGRVRLHVSIDALILDAFSFLIIHRELQQLYLDPTAALPPLEPSFRDYVLAEVAARDTEPYRRAWSYWQQRISALPPAPELPLARSPASLGTPRFTRRSGGLEPARWERLKKRAAQAGLTPSGLIAATFGETLGAWSKNRRLTLNLTLFRRLPIHPQIEQVVGDFTSLTLLAIEPRPDAPFEVRARAVQERLWTDLDHSHVNGVRVMRELARQGGGPTGALMPVVLTSMLSLADLSEGGAERPGGGESGELVYTITQTPQVWLDHQVFESAGGLGFNWDAVEELFPAGLLEAMFGAYGRLLESLAESEASWSAVSFPWLPESQGAVRRRVNETAAPIPEGLLHTPFERQALLRPDSLAVIAANRRLTYGELHRRAAALGERLRRLGARPNRLVGVVMEKGWEQVVAVLGVLRSGAAYLPIDAGLPRERQWHLLEHGEVEVVLTQGPLERSLAWPAGVQVLVVGGETGDEAGGALPGWQAPAQGPDDLAYVIFTSGSTGQPKGVMIEHRAALNTIADVNRRFGVDAGDRVLALSSLSFDLSVYDIFGLLSVGGTLVLAEPAAGRDPARWAELIASERVTVWNTVPALLEMLVEYAGGRPEVALGSLRTVLLSGDWIGLSLPARLRALAAEAQVTSLGGATEAAIWSNYFAVGEVDGEWASIPYGLPLSNQWFHVLDEVLQPRPDWVAGELYIGGAGLARGYWRDEERTRAQFLTHPESGERLYRTGDLGRYRGDGVLEFLGREDFQVKIQGHRIELGEIESALSQHPAVRAAVVAAVGQSRSDRRLVAYVVPEESVTEPAAGDGAVWLEPPLPEEPPLVMPASAADPLATVQLKLQQPGLRRGDAGRPSLRLPRLAADPVLWDGRRSERQFSAGPLALEGLARTLAALTQVEQAGSPLPKYRYPSAGNLYPVQTYLWLKPGRTGSLASGAYYYHPKEHRLVLLREGADLDRQTYFEVNHPVFEESAFALFLVAQRRAIEPLYGDLARELCLLEAGAMGQLLMSVAPREGLGLCPIGSLDAEPLAGLFGLDEGHLLVHSFLGGPRAEGFLASGDGAPAVLPRLPETRWPAAAAGSGTHEPPSPGLPMDELAQLGFKLSERGLRRGDDAPSILLERPPLDPTLVASFASRRTYREFDPAPVRLDDLGALLGSLRQLALPGRALPKYLYPSAGSLYPVQAYLWIKPRRVEQLPGGTYYYHPRDHRLVLLRRDVEIDSAVHVEINRGPADQAAFALFLIADRRVIEPLYGGLARDLCLLEAGYVSQLLMTDAPAAGLGLCPVGRLDFAAVRNLFALHEEHALVFTLLGGGLPAVAWAGAAVRRAAALDARPEALRAFLLGKLPAYMVPSVFVLLDDLPLTANGKVDRLALPEPELDAAPIHEAAYVAPEGETEQTLAGILQEILGRAEIGVHDNFFDLGANSVHIVQAHGRLRNAFGREVPLVEMFNHPTISALARYLDQGDAESGDFGMSEERVERLKEGQGLLKRRRESRRRLVEVPE